MEHAQVGFLHNACVQKDSSNAYAVSNSRLGQRFQCSSQWDMLCMLSTCAGAQVTTVCGEASSLVHETGSLPVHDWTVGLIPQDSTK